MTRGERVRARAIPQLRDALAAGDISLYRAGEISKLPAEQQECAVAQWRERSLLRSEGQRIAADTIREVLQAPRSIDLDEVSAAISEAIRSSRASR
jgi:hypothetical protein